MARALKIPREEVLRSAMNVFWAKGYNATTMDDLQEAMGLQRGSIYLHFKDKKGLFAEVLDFYKTEVVEKRRALIQQSQSAKAGIELFFQNLIDHSIKNRKIPGCLNTNSATELGATDLNFQKSAAAGLRTWELFWVETLKRAQAQGELSKEKDVKALARSLIALTQGINVVGKINPDRAYLKEIVRTTLSLID